MTVNLFEVRLGVGVAGCGHDEHLARTLEGVDAVLTEAGAQAIARVLVTAEGSTRAEQIAVEHGWSFRRISAALPRTLAAAREAARRAAGGDATLLVDGDVAMSAGWFLPALQQLAEQERLAGVGGAIDEAHWARRALVGGRKDVYGTGAGGPARMVRDVGLWRRAAIDAVGGFDSWLPSEDEAELAGRVRAAGFSLWNLAATAGSRHGVPRESMAETRAFITGPGMSGPGIVLRRARGTMTFAGHIARYQGALLLFAWIVLGATASIVLWNSGVGMIWLWATLGLLAFFAVLKQSLPRAFWSGVRTLAVGTSALRALVIPVGGARMGAAPRPLAPPKEAGEEEEQGEAVAQAGGGGMPFRGAPRDPDDAPPVIEAS